MSLNLYTLRGKGIKVPLSSLREWPVIPPDSSLYNSLSTLSEVLGHMHYILWLTDSDKAFSGSPEGKKLCLEWQTLCTFDEKKIKVAHFHMISARRSP